jgi:hypothetical protein
MGKPREILSAASLAVAVVVVGTSTVASAHSGGDSKVHDIDIQDDCDPVTFNEAGVPGGCVGDGDTTFEELFEELQEKGEHGKWRFHPDELTIRGNDRLRAVNEGGEVHTFTKVDRFGPGCVPEINDVIGLDGPPVADCSRIEDSLLVPRASRVVPSLNSGLQRFECLIHPWMRTVVTVESR